MAKSLLDETKAPLLARAKELEPMVSEYNEIQDVIARLDGTTPTPAPAPRARPSAVSTPPKPKAKPAVGRRGRPKGSGQRGQQALELVKERPGITIPELADAMGIKQNYLYRLMPGLQADGQIKKKDKGWYPA